MRDWCFRPECLERFVQPLAAGGSAQLADCGHYVVEDAHERIVPLVRAFLLTVIECQAATTAFIGQCATLACLLEATAPKVGNVHRGADFDDLTFTDFAVSAALIAPAMEAAAERASAGPCSRRSRRRGRPSRPTPTWEWSCSSRRWPPSRAASR